MSKQKDGLSPPYFILTKPNENDHLQRKVRSTFFVSQLTFRRAHVHQNDRTLRKEEIHDQKVEQD